MRNSFRSGQIPSSLTASRALHTQSVAFSLTGGTATVDCNCWRHIIIGLLVVAWLPSCPPLGLSESELGLLTLFSLYSESVGAGD
mmetsp:Transcript_2521/g.5729  ORF Transcript_2521/g.5729 Transcript_2521/m.5729 type:complete len:85 (+) Transcript_2521:2-256(+)